MPAEGWCPMRVSELITLLERFPPGAPVGVSDSIGPYYGVPGGARLITDGTFIETFYPAPRGPEPRDAPCWVELIVDAPDEEINLVAPEDAALVRALFPGEEPA